MAERYYTTYWLFPIRAASNPASVHELVRKVLGSMPASMLGQSAASARDFPRLVTFQHLFLTGFARHTCASCFICPELSKVFPAEPNEQTNGQIDFYLNGELRWGIELLVRGDDTGTHLRRFAPGGKFAAPCTLWWIFVAMHQDVSQMLRAKRIGSRSFTNWETSLRADAYSEWKRIPVRSFWKTDEEPAHTCLGLGG